MSYVLLREALEAEADRPASGASLTLRQWLNFGRNRSWVHYADIREGRQPDFLFPSGLIRPVGSTAETIRFRLPWFGFPEGIAAAFWFSLSEPYSLSDSLMLIQLSAAIRHN